MAEGLIEMLDQIGTTPPQFNRRAYYSSAGDCLYFYFDEAEAYRDRINSLLTVYRSFSDNKVTGFQIKGVKTLLSELCDFGFRWKEEGVELRVLMLGASTFARDEDPLEEDDRRALRDLAQQLGMTRVKPDELQEA